MARIRGIGAMRRRLREMPEAIAEEIGVVLRRAGPRIQMRMRARTPRRTNALATGIVWKYFPRSQRLEVGVTTKGRQTSGRGASASRFPLFYGRIQDLGRKPQIVNVRRRTTGGKTVSYRLNVRAMAGKHFVTGENGDLRNEVSAGLQGIFARALGRTGGGA